MSDIKLCKDCRWFLDQNPAEGTGSKDWVMILPPVCEHEKSLVRDLVRGNHSRACCEAMRIHGCGPEGTLWEPRP